jgi:C4-dicarboxylate-specific signal transduction histidine kinase
MLDYLYSDRFTQETNEFGHWGLFNNEKAREVIVDLWRTKQVAHRSDLAENDQYQEAHWMDEIRSVVDVPFTQGTLAVNNPMPHAFSDEHIEVLKKIALVLAEGFQRREDLNRLENRNSLLETEINKHKETEEALQNARDELEKRVDERTAQLGTANAQLHREILKYQQAVAALQAGEERLRLALQATNEGVVGGRFC